MWNSWSVSAGLDYPAVGPEHAFLKDSGRAQYVGATDQEALDAFALLARTEGIVGFFGGDFTDPKWIEGGRQEMEVNFLGTFAVTQAFDENVARGGHQAAPPPHGRARRRRRSRLASRSS